MSLFRPYELNSTETTTTTTTTPLTVPQAATAQHHQNTIPTQAAQLAAAVGLPAELAASSNMQHQMAMLLAAHTAAAAARAAEMEQLMRRSEVNSSPVQLEAAMATAAKQQLMSPQGPREEEKSPISDPGSPIQQIPPRSPSCESPVTLTSESPNHHD